MTLITVGLLRHSPTSYPPLFSAPWFAPSLHHFWSKSWHQLLRQTFLYLGGYPLGYLFGLPGYVFGTFMGSGLFHYWALYAMGKGTDVRTLWFFLWQALALGLERAWRSVTGRRVGGRLGTAWVWFCVVGGAMWCGEFCFVSLPLIQSLIQLSLLTRHSGCMA